MPESAHGTNPATAALLGYSVVAVPARDDGTVRAADVRRLLAEHAGEIAAIMLTNPNTCGIFEPEVAEIAEAVHDGRRLFLLRRRQPQRHHGQGEAGRSRRRRHAHQPAQDVLDAAWRRRSGRRAGGAVGGARALRAGAVRRRATATASAWSSTRRTRATRKPLGRMSAFHGQMGMFVRAYGLDALARLRRHAAGVRGRGAQRQLHPRRG